MKATQRGIVLISILVLTVVATLFLGALLQMNPGRLQRTVHTEERERAVAAAQAGVEYALSRLSHDLTWKAEGEGVVVDSSHLVIREDRGNVLGWIRTESSDWAHFRLRFNPQATGSYSGGFPMPEFPLDLPEISCNNLLGASSRPLLLGTGGNGSYQGEHGFPVPEYSVALVVEGAVGPGLSPENPIGDLSDAGVVRRRLASTYQVSQFGVGSADGSVLMAAGDSNFTVGSSDPSDPASFRGFLRLAADDQVARMRTKGEAAIQLGAGKTSPFVFYPDQYAEVAVGSGAFSPTANHGDFEVLEETADDPFLEVAWEKVSQSEQADPIQLPAGVYTFEETSGGEVKYYPMSWESYRTARVAGEEPASATVPVSFSDRVELGAVSFLEPDGTSRARHTVTFEKDVEVQPVGALKDLAIVPARGARPALETWGGEALESTPAYGPGAGGGPQVVGPAPAQVTAQVTGGNSNPSTFIPESGGFTDSVAPQDIEVRFEPEPGGTATLRSEGSMLFGTRLSGTGGALVAGDRLDLVGLGVDLEAGVGDAGGISLYARNDIRISTFDESRSKYWDVSIKGVVFTKGDLIVQLGEEGASGPSGPLDWGVFDYAGAIIALGDAIGVQGTQGPGGRDGDGGDGGGDRNFLGVNNPGQGNHTRGQVRFTADGVRLVYEPRFLAPYLEDEQLMATFKLLSTSVH